MFVSDDEKRQVTLKTSELELKGTYQDGQVGVGQVIFEEGFVCGTLDVWNKGPEGINRDPDNGSYARLVIDWVKPDGSVAEECKFMESLEGEFLSISQNRRRAKVYGHYHQNAFFIDETGAEISNAMLSYGVLSQEVLCIVQEFLGKATRSHLMREWFVVIFELSLWQGDAIAGNGSNFSVTWEAPKGSVAELCQDMTSTEGKYQRIADIKPEF